ncbi:MAG: DUF4238 domain-containing protein [Elusimicrobia bacterium]|nr:DUF4238 domain-containing protein [Elusimicrobiota bacterium]
MALDHFVSQVHLKRFYSPVLGNRLHAIRKDNLKQFAARAKDVCRIEDGSSNAYLKNAGAIEEFLKGIEPKYNSAVEALLNGQIDSQCIYTIAGFAAYIAACSPTAMRLNSEPFQQLVEATGNILEIKGMLPPAPAALGSTSFTELVRTGKVRIEVDPKYPQAIGLANIYKHIAMFGNFKWEVLINEIPDSEFFTCDYPAAMETSRYPLVFNRIVPLTPTLAIRICPDIRIEKSKADFSFRSFGWRRHSVTRNELLAINRLIVRCADKEVYFCAERPWIKGFIEKNRNYRLESYTTRFPTGNGHLHMHSHRLVNRSGH